MALISSAMIGLSLLACDSGDAVETPAVKQAAVEQLTPAGARPDAETAVTIEPVIGRGDL